MKIQTIALAAAVAVAPVAASAMTIAVGGGTGTYLLGDCPGGASMVIGDVTAAGGAGSHDVSFESCSEPANGIANASITIAVASVFENLTMSWENGESVVITDGSGNLGHSRAYTPVWRCSLERSNNLGTMPPRGLACQGFGDQSRSRFC